MANIVISNLDEPTKQALQSLAAEHGRSLEEEAREILKDAVGRSTPPANVAAAIREHLKGIGGVDLEIPDREQPRTLPKL
ncbi:MAG: plasmid stabilization protein [Pseudomonadota bacterium]